VSDLESFYYVPVTYTLTDEDVEVTDGVIQSCSYHFASRRLIIPDTLDGQAVLGFAEMDPSYFGMGYIETRGIFSGKGLEHVTFPSTIESIDNHTFCRNQLSSIDLSECTALTSIGDGAFEDNSLTTLDLSACIALTSIGVSAFWQNNLTTLDLSASTDLRTIDSYSFSENRLTSVNLSECSALTKIGDDAFWNNDLSDIDLSSCRSLSSVGCYAFSGNALSGFVLPVNNDYDSFGWKDLKGNHYYGGNHVSELGTTYYVPVAYTITDEDVVVKEGVIQSCSYNFAFRRIIFPDTLDGQKVTGIVGQGSENGMFRNKGIVDLVLPSTIEVIGEDAFAYNHLRSLDLSSYQALTCIGSHAFSDNELSSLDLSGCASLKSIGDGAFGEHSLTSLDLSGCTALISIGAHAFRTERNYLNKLRGLVLPEHGEYQSYGWKDGNGKEYSGGSRVTAMGISYYVPIPYILTDKDVVVTEGMIQSCSYDFAYKYIIIPETLDGQTVIGISNAEPYSESGWPQGVFSGREIGGITLPSTIEVIGDHAFEWNLLSSLDVSACRKLRIIGNGAFDNNQLDSLDLNACVALETIGESAFSFNNITRIHIDSCRALNSIGRYAFFNYENEIKNINFSSCTALRIIGENAFWGSQTTQIDLSACHSLISVGKEAFAGGLTDSLVLPINTEYDAYGWEDLKGTTYDGGNIVTDLETIYYIPVPYTLTDEDVEVVEGNIKSCSYDLAFRKLIIPDTLDGQPIYGIYYDPERFQGVFSNCGMVAVKLPSTLRFIADDAFERNSLTNVDFSACRDLTTIGQGAFHSNNLTQIDLSACSALTAISWGAFGGNKFSSIILPTPEVPGFTFLYWLDRDGKAYPGGATITQFSMPYTALISTLTPDYRITFVLSEESKPVPGARVTLSGYGYRLTNIAGQAVFTDVLTVNELEFTVTAEGFENASGVVSLVDTDVMKHITLILATGVNERSEDRFWLYPNPARSVVHVQTSEEALVRIISLSGRTMLFRKVQNGQTTIQISHLEPGVYIFCAESGHEVYTRKLIIR
jgi:hypothetical protein